MTVWAEPIRFQWDAGNIHKNWIKHRVTHAECEEAFFDPHKRLFHPAPRTERETRYGLIGQTKDRRLLVVIFTVRGPAIRVISARDLNKRERGLYEEGA